MEDNAIQEYIETIAELFQAISSKPINTAILDEAKTKYPLVDELKVPPTNLFDNYKQFYRYVLDQIIYTIEHEIVKVNLTSLIAVDEDIKIFIDTIKLIAKHSKYYEPKEIRFYFSTFRDLVCQKLQYNDYMRCLMVHVFFIGKNDFVNLFTPMINELYYPFLFDFIIDELKCEQQDIYKTYEKDQDTLDKESILNEKKTQMIDQYYNNQQFEDLWDFYKNNYISKKKARVFNHITYNDPYLFQILLLNDDLAMNFIDTCEIQIDASFSLMNPFNNCIPAIKQVLYSDFVRQKFANIMKTQPIYNFYTNINLVNETTTKNYLQFIDFINLNNNTIPTSALDYYIIPVILKAGIHGVTNNYQRIAINSYYKCFQISNYNHGKSTATGYGNYSVKDTLFIASLIMIILHESNHFLRRYNTNPKTIKEVITPRKEEGGKEFYRQIFGNSDIKELTLPQAKAILVEDNWNKNDLLTIFEKKESKDPTMKFMQTTESNCFRCQ